MIKIFEHDATNFTSNGIGALPDATYCNVFEERNGEFELEMDYPITGKRYEELALRRIIVAKSNPFSNPQPFRIYEIGKPIHGIVTVKAAHISYDLSGLPASPFTGATAQLAFQNFKMACPVTCPFSFFTDKEISAEMKVVKPSSMRALLGGTEGSFLDLYKGEYEFDGFNVKLLTNRGMNRGVKIRYGKNLTDLTQEENCNNVYTGVYPYWYSEQDGLVELDEKIVNAEGTYNFVRIKPLDLSSEYTEKPSKAAIKSYAQSYIKNNDIGVPKVSLNVSFVSLADAEEDENLKFLEEIHLCDTVTVVFEKLGVNATAKCIKTSYDVLTDKYVRIMLGDAKSNLASTIATQNSTISNQAGDINGILDSMRGIPYDIEQATKLITGGLGGYVLLHSSTGAKQPDEILIMDKPDISTAKNVWRWNKNGLGFSSTGYNGKYGIAMTSDGKIVADYIGAGTINGITINGTNINGSTFKSTGSYTRYAKDYDASEHDRLLRIVNGVITPTEADILKYDFNNDGVITLSDLIEFTRLVDGYDTEQVVDNTIEIHAEGTPNTLSMGGVKIGNGFVRANSINAEKQLYVKKIYTLDSESGGWVTGATGSFIDNNGHTVYVRNGIITMIV